MFTFLSGANRILLIEILRKLNKIEQDIENLREGLEITLAEIRSRR